MFEEFKTGSIVASEEEIPIERTATYFIFKVVIGRSYVRSRAAMDKKNAYDKMQPPEGYDSVYIREDGDGVPINAPFEGQVS